MRRFTETHGNCYGNGCPGCQYRGWVVDEEAEATYADYKRDMQEEDDDV